MITASPWPTVKSERVSEALWRATPAPGPPPTVQRAADPHGGPPGVGTSTFPAALSSAARSNSQPDFSTVSERCRAPGSLLCGPHPVSPKARLFPFSWGLAAAPASAACASLPASPVRQPPGSESKLTSSAGDASFGVSLPCENAGPSITDLPQDSQSHWFETHGQTLAQEC